MQGGEQNMALTLTAEEQENAKSRAPGHPVL